MKDQLSHAMVTPFFPRRRSRIRWMQWLRDEYQFYADPKFDESREADHDPHMRDEGVGPDSWWENQVVQYIRRAHVLGLDTLAGRQALFKGFAAYSGMLESCVRVYGDPPAAGYPSGEIHPS